MLAKDLNELITRYGSAMAEAAERVLVPVHKHEDPLLPLGDMERNRTRESQRVFQFFPSQKVKVTALVKGFAMYDRLWLISDMGTGKTVMALAVMHRLLNPYGPYRTLVMCPGHIVRKWRREVEWTIPNVYCRIVRTFGELQKFKELALKHNGPSVMIISKESAKLGFDVDKPCASTRIMRFTEIMGQGDPRLNTPREYMVGREIQNTLKSGEYVVGPHYEERVCLGYDVCRTLPVTTCPTCGAMQRDKKDDKESPLAYHLYLSRNEPIRCWKCNDKLSTNAYGFRKNPHLDRYIQRKMKGFFDFMIPDEVHELAAAETIQGNTFGTLAASCRYVLALTGTLIGGKAEDLHAPLWRMSPELVKNRGFDISRFQNGRVGAIARNATAFIREYGVLEHVEVRGLDDDASGKVKRGACGRRKSHKEDERPRPGISPNLFNHMLIGRAVFMGLHELGPALPTLTRELVSCKMSKELKEEYDRIDGVFQSAIKEKKKKGAKGPPVISAIRVQVLDAYADHPWGWRTVMGPVYDSQGKRCGSEPIVQPKDMGVNRNDSKDLKIVEICKKELAAGRRCCIYMSFTGEHDVRPKLQRMLEKAGLRAVQLPDTVKPIAREDWIAKNIGDIDVLIVHPKRVMTGLDLIQFPSLIWYQLGYSTHVLRQASARARRPTQTLPCKVFFLYYEKSIQEQALGLMGEKEAAAQALEGTFDVAALRALMNGGKNDDILSALSNSIGKDREDPREIWAKVAAQNPIQAPNMPARKQVTAAPLPDSISESSTKVISSEFGLFDLPVEVEERLALLECCA